MRRQHWSTAFERWHQHPRLCSNRNPASQGNHQPSYPGCNCYRWVLVARRLRKSRWTSHACSSWTTARQQDCDWIGISLCLAEAAAGYSTCWRPQAWPLPHSRRPRRPSRSSTRHPQSRAVREGTAPPPAYPCAQISPAPPSALSSRAPSLPCESVILSFSSPFRFLVNSRLYLLALFYS